MIRAAKGKNSVSKFRVKATFFALVTVCCFFVLMNAGVFANDENETEIIWLIDTPVPTATAEATATPAPPSPPAPSPDPTHSPT